MNVKKLKLIIKEFTVGADGKPYYPPDKTHGEILQDHGWKKTGTTKMGYDEYSHKNHPGHKFYHKNDTWIKAFKSYPDEPLTTNNTEYGGSSSDELKDRLKGFK